MSDPVSLRNIPQDVLRVAHILSRQTGLSVNAVLRLALASGILIEVTKVPPAQDGTYGGLGVEQLAIALRRHLGAAVDLLMEQGQHPYQVVMLPGNTDLAHVMQQEGTPRQIGTRNTMTFDSSIGEDLDALGIGSGLSETIG
jgi:hypothetical protein